MASTDREPFGPNAAHLTPVTGAASDYDSLLDAIGDAALVLIGEASHGTHEFYRERARITRRLIDERGFHAVAIEGDWPDAARVDRFVRQLPPPPGLIIAGAHTHPEPPDASARDALGGFRRFPSWMWRNADVARFLEWLHVRNAAERFAHRRVGFYGLDLYSMRTSMDAVIDYLSRVDPAAAHTARQRYACFDQVGIADPENVGQEYGYAVTRGGLDPCEDAVIAELVDLAARRAAFLSLDGQAAEDAYFDAARNAELVHDAEVYYRAMYHGRTSSWNLRDTHMVDTLAALRDHLGTRVDTPKIVVWEHNSHVGDARATELGSPERPGGLRQHNVGQLVRERWPDEAFIVGLTTSHGTVTAASDWGGPMQRKVVRPSGPGSFEHALSGWGVPAFVALTGRGPLAPDGAAAPGQTLLERAIGVIYRPETERLSHWFGARIHEQFDAVLHIDRTSALEPLDRTDRWDRGEPPETYPSGL